jgi:hypothetical protein
VVGEQFYRGWRTVLSWLENSFIVVGEQLQILKPASQKGNRGLKKVVYSLYNSYKDYY